MTFEELKRKKAELEAELARLEAEAKAKAEAELKKLADALIEGMISAGFSRWVYEPDGEDNLKVIITQKRAPRSTRKGKQYKITAPDGQVFYSDTAIAFVREHGIPHPEGSFSAVRLLRDKGYTVEEIVLTEK